MKSHHRLGELALEQEPSQWSNQTWWRSALILIPYFKTRLEFSICDNTTGSKLGADISTAIDQFLKLTEEDRIAHTHKLYTYYQMILEITDNDPLDIKSSTDLWEHLQPHNLEILRPSEHSSSPKHKAETRVYVLVQCYCDWEEEQGVQFIFYDGLELADVRECGGF